MKIIIIGYKGMLGQELANAFQKYNPILWDREEIDITDADMVRELLSKENPQLVINAAAYNNVDGAEDSPDIAYAVNSKGPKNLALALSGTDGIIVHYSTDYVFKGDKEDGYTETDTPDPQSEYAKSKYQGEEEIKKITGKYYIIRLSRLFGKPAVASGAKRSFIDKIVELSKNREVVDIIDDEFSSPTYALDLANRTKEIIFGNYQFGIYHGANRGGCTWYGLAKKTFEILGKEVKINPVGANFYPRKAVRPHFSLLQNTQLPPARKWEEALEEYLKSNEILEN